MVEIQEKAEIDAEKSTADLFENLLPWLSDLERKKIKRSLELIRKEISTGDKKKAAVLTGALIIKILQIRNENNEYLLAQLMKIFLAANS